VSRARRLKVIVEADGGARGNPGPAGYGAVVKEATTGEVLVERNGGIGVATNNVAEYQGLVAGLQAAADLGAVDVEVRMDSKLVVEQMSGRWQIKHPGLRPLAAKAAVIAGRFESVRYVWIPRSENARADALANAAMDGKSADEVAEGSGSSIVEPVADLTPRSWLPSSHVATRIVLVRHGETELNAQRRYSGRGDVALSDKGRAQAEAAARRVGAAPLAAVLTSPLVRAVHTAEVIAERAAALQRVASVPVVVEPDLVECDFGEWEGLTFTEVKERSPELLDTWLASPSTAPPGGESFEDVAVRVNAVLAKILADHPGATVAVVSHVTPIKLLLRDALAASDTFLHRLFLDPTGVSIVDYFADGGIAVRTVNDTAHLL